MRRDYIQPGGAWSATHVPEPSELRTLDQAASELVNGDGGGDYSPEDPIVVGGSGVQLHATGGLAGGVTTGRNAAGGGALILGDNDLPIFTTPQTLTRIIPLRDFFSRYDQMRPEVGNFLPNDFPYYEHDLSGVQNPGYAFKVGLTSIAVAKNTKLIGAIPPSVLINGGRFSSITLRMRVPAPITYIPTSLPGFRIWRIGPTGSYLGPGSDLYRVPTWSASTFYNTNAVVVPTTLNGKQFRAMSGGVSGGSQPAAFASALPGQSVLDSGVTWMCEPGPTVNLQQFCTLAYATTSSAFYKAGKPQDIVMNADTGLQVHTIDTTTYTYLYEVFDPSSPIGASVSANKYHSLIISMNGIQRLVPVF